MIPDLHTGAVGAAVATARAQIAGVAPAKTPWKASRGGGVSAVDSLVLGYSRTEVLGQYNVAQAAARWFAAAPAFAEAAVALHGAAARFASLAKKASKNPELQAAIVEAVAGERLLLAAFEATLDELVVPTAAINAQTADLIARLPRISLE